MARPPDALAVRRYMAPGGAGKTRFMLERCLNKEASSHAQTRLDQALALLTLVGGLPDAEVPDLLTTLPGWDTQPRERIDTLLDVLRTAYPRHAPDSNQRDGIDALRPVRLGEAHVLRALARTPTLADPLLNGDHVAWLSAALTVLSRAAEHHAAADVLLQQHFADHWQDWLALCVSDDTTTFHLRIRLGDALADVGQRVSSAELLRSIDTKLSETLPRPLAWMPLAEVCVQNLLGLSTKPTDKNELDFDALNARAGLLNNQAVRLSDLGRREDALSAAQQAVDLYRKLADARPDTFLPNLATSLGALGSVHLHAHAPESAAECFLEGADRLLPLARTLPQAHLPLLAQLVGDVMNAQQAGAPLDEARLTPILEFLAPYMGSDNGED